MDQPGTAATPTPAAGGLSSGFKSVQGAPRTDNTMNTATPCVPSFSPGDREQQVTPQLLTAPEAANTEKGASKAQPKQGDEDPATQNGAQVAEGAVAEGAVAAAEQPQQEAEQAAAATDAAQGEGEKANGATQGAQDADDDAGLQNGMRGEEPAAMDAADAPGDNTAAINTRNTDGNEEQPSNDKEAEPGEAAAVAAAEDSSAKAAVENVDPDSKCKESMPGGGESVTNVAGAVPARNTCAAIS